MSLYTLYVKSNCFQCGAMKSILPKRGVKVVSLDGVDNHTFYQIPVLINTVTKKSYTNANDIRIIFAELEKGK